MEGGACQPPTLLMHGLGTQDLGGAGEGSPEEPWLWAISGAPTSKLSVAPMPALAFALWSVPGSPHPERQEEPFNLQGRTGLLNACKACYPLIETGNGGWGLSASQAPPAWIGDTGPWWCRCEAHQSSPGWWALSSCPHLKVVSGLVFAAVPL